MKNSSTATKITKKIIQTEQFNKKQVTIQTNKICQKYYSTIGVGIDCT